MALRKAKRSEAKLKIGMSGPSGSGKTYSALLFAKGFMGDLSSVAVLDTENGSADLYADIGDYSIESFSPPYHPQRYAKAISYFYEQGIKLMVIDSASHEWDGSGGCLEIHSNMAGNSFQNWAKVTPMHREFVDAVLQTPMHIIVTTRRKQDYVLEENSKGKMQPRKVGLKEVQRDGFEYELTLQFDIDINHYATASKDRTNLFSDGVPFKISEETGIMVREWNGG